MERRISTVSCRLWSRLRRLGERGASAMEFALVAPLAVLILFFSIEMGVVMLADATLEAAASRVSRIGQLGVPAGKTCEETVKATFENLMGNWVVGPSHLYVDARVYQPGQNNDFPSVDDPDYVPTCDAGNRGDLVLYRLGFDNTGFSGIMTWLGIRVLKFERRIVIQNEP
ncbi:hypothetical protein GSY71_10215 [Pusillimonas sp. TS35]|uniref:TadE/TadG family type IV pilus assembly protein n=1 Tax=Paracandidimonas lactea TaxID=2895524 RepID=UPI0013688E92|nr:TadE family protein [Paracandidimonas lactea]MYN13509.1 hypothetical protein [Pusillimonas sp. TS35]